MRESGDEILYYIIYAVILAIFFIILKLPKKGQKGRKEKRNISTSEKFNKKVKKEDCDGVQ